MKKTVYIIDLGVIRHIGVCLDGENLTAQVPFFVSDEDMHEQIIAALKEDRGLEITELENKVVSEDEFIAILNENVKDVQEAAGSAE